MGVEVTIPATKGIMRMGPWGLRRDIDELPYTGSLYVTLLQDHLFSFLWVYFMGEELCRCELSPFAVSQDCLVWKRLLCLVDFVWEIHFNVLCEYA